MFVAALLLISFSNRATATTATSLSCARLFAQSTEQEQWFLEAKKVYAQFVRDRENAATTGVDSSEFDAALAAIRREFKARSELSESEVTSLFSSIEREVLAEIDFETVKSRARREAAARPLIKSFVLGQERAVAPPIFSPDARWVTNLDSNGAFFLRGLGAENLGKKIQLDGPSQPRARFRTFFSQDSSMIANVGEFEIAVWKSSENNWKKIFQLGKYGFVLPATWLSAFDGEPVLVIPGDSLWRIWSQRFGLREVNVPVVGLYSVLAFSADGTKVLGHREVRNSETTKIFQLRAVSKLAKHHTDYALEAVEAPGSLGWRVLAYAPSLEVLVVSKNKEIHLLKWSASDRTYSVLSHASFKSRFSSVEPESLQVKILPAIDTIVFLNKRTQNPSASEISAFDINSGDSLWAESGPFLYIETNGSKLFVERQSDSFIRVYSDPRVPNWAIAANDFSKGFRVGDTIETEVTTDGQWLRFFGKAFGRPDLPENNREDILLKVGEPE